MTNSTGSICGCSVSVKYSLCRLTVEIISLILFWALVQFERQSQTSDLLSWMHEEKSMLSEWLAVWLAVLLSLWSSLPSMLKERSLLWLELCENVALMLSDVLCDALAEALRE